MKNKRFLFLLALSLLLLLSSCAERRVLLSAPVGEGRSVSLLGSGDRPDRISVSDSSGEIWKRKLSVKKEIASLDSGAWLSVADFNFDGLPDLAVAEKSDGDVIYRSVFLAGSDRSYRKSDFLSSLGNLAVADHAEGSLFSFDRSVTTGRGEEARKITVTTDTATKYLWVDGAPVPEIRVSLTAYSDTGMRCYAVSYYDGESGAWDSYEDQWLTEDEFENADFSFLYYFR